MASFKVEPNAGIKQELDGDQSQRFLDDNDYEDAGDLDIPKASQKAWLARTPTFLFRNWDAEKSEGNGKMGVLRYYEDTKTWKLVVDESNHIAIPVDYKMQLEKDTSNSNVYSEKDLPGYKKQQQKIGTLNGGGIDRKGRFNRFRRSIPKQTALAASVETKIECHPDQKQFEAYARGIQSKAAEKPNGVTFISTNAELEFAKTDIGKTLFDSNTRGVAKSKTQQVKTARMPENELRDALFDCFSQYKYWPMKALRHRLQQPEAYLKEVLSNIADLMKSGTEIGCYTLKPEYQSKMATTVKHEIANEGEDEDDEDEEDDDGDVSMNE